MTANEQWKRCVVCLFNTKVGKLWVHWSILVGHSEFAIVGRSQLAVVGRSLLAIVGSVWCKSKNQQFKKFKRF